MRRRRRLPDRALFDLGVPVLGICYGLQLLAQYLGGKVENGQKREYGKGTLRVKDPFCPLFAGLPKELQVWNSHGDRLTKLPAAFKSVAVTDNSAYAAIERRDAQVVRPAVSPGGGPHAAGQDHHRQFRAPHLRLRQELDDAELRRPGRGGDSQAGRRGAGDPRPERRCGFERRRGPAPQGHWRPAHVHLRQQRPAARARAGGRARSLWPPLPDQAAVRGRLEALPAAAAWASPTPSASARSSGAPSSRYSRGPPGAPARRSSSRRARFTRT